VDKPGNQIFDLQLKTGAENDQGAFSKVVLANLDSHSSKEKESDAKSSKVNHRSHTTEMRAANNNTQHSELSVKIEDQQVRDFDINP
jgi:hypothetical protein